MYFEDEMSQEVFSVFEFRYKCDSAADADGYCTYKTMIEPLSFFLRHPAALCKSKFPTGSRLQSKLLEGKQETLMDQNYLFYATNEQATFGPAERTHVDLGALVPGAV